MTLPYQSSGWQQPYLLPSRPGAVTTFYVYCALMVVIYLLVAVVGVFFMTMAAEIAADDPEMTEVEARVMGIVFLAMGAVLAIIFAIPPFLPRAKWAWIVGIIAIAFGLTSCCFWPLCIPLLIYYVQEPTRLWYGMQPPSAYAPMHYDPRYGGGA